MAANWNKPTTASLYADFVNEGKDRDIDAVTLNLNPGSNIPSGAIKYDRAASKFQEWSGAAWSDLVLSVAGGGTGSATAAGARTNLGLGSISTQTASAVAITGGAISGLTALAMAASGNLTFATDATSNIGADASRVKNIYIRSGLVVPVGADKWVTA